MSTTPPPRTNMLPRLATQQPLPTPIQSASTALQAHYKEPTRSTRLARHALSCNLQDDPPCGDTKSRNLRLSTLPMSTPSPHSTTCRCDPSPRPSTRKARSSTRLQKLSRRPKYHAPKPTMSIPSATFSKPIPSTTPIPTSTLQAHFFLSRLHVGLHATVLHEEIRLHEGKPTARHRASCRSIRAPARQAETRAHRPASGSTPRLQG